MRIFNFFSKGFNEGRERARKEAYRRRDIPVKLVEPSTGRIVELKVIEPNNVVAEMYMILLEKHAKDLEKFSVKYDINYNDKTIRFTYPDGDLAESARKPWKEWFILKEVNRPKGLFTSFFTNVSGHIKPLWIYHKKFIGIFWKYYIL